MVSIIFKLNPMHEVKSDGAEQRSIPELALINSIVIKQLFFEELLYDDFSTHSWTLLWFVLLGCFLFLGCLLWL